MTKYRVLMSDELHEEIERDGGSRLPERFRILRVVAQPGERIGELPSYQSLYVEVEDIDAPADLEGKLVEPTFQAHYDSTGEWINTTIADRRAWDYSLEDRALVYDGHRRSVTPSGRGFAIPLPPYSSDT